MLTRMFITSKNKYNKKIENAIKKINKLTANPELHLNLMLKGSKKLNYLSMANDQLLTSQHGDSNCFGKITYPL